MPGPPKRHWTTHVGQAAGHPAAFVVVILYAVLWMGLSRDTFDWNAVATLAVFVMTLFIQRANRRDNLALHAKLDELLRVDEQMNIIDYEIGVGLFKRSREESLSRERKAHLAAPVDSRDVFYRFDGEYWSDELNDYSVFADDRCVQ